MHVEMADWPDLDPLLSLKSETVRCAQRTLNTAEEKTLPINQHPDQPKVQQLMNLLSMSISCGYAPLSMLDFSRAVVVRGLILRLWRCCMADESSVCLGDCILFDYFADGHFGVRDVVSDVAIISWVASHVVVTHVVHFHCG